jgi:uncharacterized alkaline shock family protein YloU
MTETLTIEQMQQLKEVAENKITDILHELESTIGLKIETVNVIRQEHVTSAGILTTLGARIRISL